MTCPRPGSRWVAEPRAQQPALFAPCFCSLLLPSPPFLPSSMAQASPVYPRGWTRNGGSPWEAEAQSGWELPEHRRCLHRPLCCTAGPLGRRWAPSGASTALGTPEDKANARTWLPSEIRCWISVHPLLYVLTYLYGDLSASVCSSTDLRLTRPRQVGKILGWLQGTDRAHGPAGGEEGPGCRQGAVSPLPWDFAGVPADSGKCGVVRLRRVAESFSVPGGKQG